MRKPRRKIALETINRNHIPDGFLETFESKMGENNAPVTDLEADPFEDFPNPTVDPYQQNYNLIKSGRESRVERLARILVGLG